MTEKIRIYLDTNMILDVFINRAKALRKGENVLLPRKYEFMLANKEKIEFVTSFITKAEVARELAAGFDLPPKDIEMLWSTFIESTGCKFVEFFSFDSKIAYIAANSKLRLRTLFNFMHVFIAIDSNCYFVSGDKDIIKKIKLLLGYDKAIDYIEFRKLIEEDI